MKVAAVSRTGALVTTDTWYLHQGERFAASLLAATGLLDGKRASTHWMAEQDFCRRFPRVKLGHMMTPLEFMPRLTKLLGGLPAEEGVKADTAVLLGPAALCFDGDEAGLKAAFRAVDTALPVRRLISRLSRSIGLTECSFTRCAAGKLM